MPHQRFCGSINRTKLQDFTAKDDFAYRNTRLYTLADTNKANTIFERRQFLRFRALYLHSYNIELSLTRFLKQFGITIFHSISNGTAAQYTGKASQFFNSSLLQMNFQTLSGGTGHIPKNWRPYATPQRSLCYSELRNTVNTWNLLITAWLSFDCTVRAKSSLFLHNTSKSKSVYKSPW